MAAAATFGVYELGVLAAGAIGYLFLRSPAGQDAIKQTAKSAQEGLDKLTKPDPEPEEDPDQKPKPVPPFGPGCTTCKKKTCASEHPFTVLCSSLPSFYQYSSQQEAFRALKDRLGYSDLRMEKTRPSTSGPCEGSGTHTAVKSGGQYIASIVCCPCCTDTDGGPVLSTKCGLV